MPESYGYCELFAAIHELPVEYVWMEFVDPSKTDVQTVLTILDQSNLLVYNGTDNSTSTTTSH